MLAVPKKPPRKAIPKRLFNFTPAARAINQISIPISAVVLKLGWKSISNNKHTKVVIQKNF